ncbi:DUF2917 domain-containing protein [Myxococcus sp. K15C18031901]|uniref:DUF2917 domain-containing protein n=1 Tax=Myxococcus dinghuensis TaxID=2906761 RepID=UPI0020A7DAD9|nr:DUF2917 domain-containing protein [Myxococcus dinghuensis]MCP3102757.1 DUF2917 domain-containing protein [Myxococcus dinghuensis]
MARASAFRFQEWWGALWEGALSREAASGETGTLRLERGELWSRHLRPGEALWLTCREGELWVTHEGDPRDYVLEAGATMRLDRGGHTVVQALQSASLRVAHEPPVSNRV